MCCTHAKLASPPAAYRSATLVLAQALAAPVADVERWIAEDEVGLEAGDALPASIVLRLLFDTAFPGYGFTPP